MMPTQASKNYTCSCGAIFERRRTPKNGEPPRCPKCVKSNNNKRYWKRYKAAKAGEGIASIPTHTSLKLDPRIQQLSPLYLRVRDSRGHDVPHSAGELLELAAEFTRLNALAMAAVCIRKAGRA